MLSREKPIVSPDPSPLSPLSGHPINHICLPLPPSPLPRTPLSPVPFIRLPPPLLPLLLGIQHETQHIKRKLGILQAHLPERPLRLVPQHVTPLAPETGHRFPNRHVVPPRVAVHVPRVRQLGDGGRGDEVDFGVGERFEGRHGELFGEGVHLGVFEELVAGLVNGWGGGVGLQVPRG